MTCLEFAHDLRIANSAEEPATMHHDMPVVLAAGGTIKVVQ